MSKTPIQSDGDALVNAIQESVKTEVITVDDLNYTTRAVFLPPRETESDSLLLHTLTGVIDFIKSNLDGDFEHGLAVHVLSPDTVHVISGEYGRFKQRDCYVNAQCAAVLGKSFNFGQFHDAESFNIALQSLFVPTEQRDAVLRVVGNIKEEAVRTVADDGRSQTVVAKAGVARVEEVAVPNPIELQPYRTFREIPQPESLFVLRMRQGGTGSVPSCALFEADGGGWKLEAIRRIRDFLAEQLEGITIIA